MVKKYTYDEYEQLKKDAYGMDINVDDLIMINNVIDEVREERIKQKGQQWGLF